MKNNIQLNWFDILIFFIFGTLFGLLIGGMFWQPKYLEISQRYEGAIELIQHMQRGK